MPVLAIKCPDCAHTYQTLVMVNTKMPERWSCSNCGGDKARPLDEIKPIEHPWEQEGHGSGCLCCGGAPESSRNK